MEERELAEIKKRTASDIRPRDPERLRKLAAKFERQAFPVQDILRRQTEIHREMLLLSRTLDSPNFSKISVEDVARMAALYDEYFFDSEILSTAKAEGLTFNISSRMTRVAGKLVTQYARGQRNGPRKFELVLSSTLLFQTFEDVDRPVMVTGRRCNDRLEAMQRITEHELTHLVEMLIWNSGNCSEPRFQSIARRYFAHADYHHDLITQRERAAAKFDIRVGDQVRFSIDRNILVGRVNRITRRATVLVPDARGERFSDGGRYQRYYVPLECLTKIS